MWGEIIGAGISAIGSLFGGGEDEETTTTVNYREMARAAERAGFNPLTVLRNGGSAGFTTTHHPGLSMEAGIGKALGVIGNAVMAFDPRADERAKLEDDLVRARLANIQSDTALQNRMWSMDVPTAAGSTRIGGGGRPLGPPDGSPENPYRAYDTYRREDGTTFKLPSNQAPDGGQAAVAAGGDILDTRPGLTPGGGIVPVNPNKPIKQILAPPFEFPPIPPRANPKPQGNPANPYADPWLTFH